MSEQQIEDASKVKVGDRFEDLDERQGTRVIRIVEAPTLSRPAKYEVEVAELNPKTVGRRRRIKVRTLLANYRRVSR